ncbi:MAG: anti-sigma factor domain-containing protein [Pyrinomonadaceae bacterium]
MTNEKKERMLELLADQAVFGLNKEELMELGQLKSLFPDWENYISFELAATAIGLSDVNIVPLPEKLRTKILANAEEFFSPTEKSQEVINFEQKDKEGFGLLAAETVGNSVEVTPKRPFWQWMGWGVAAAACIALAISLWLTRTQPQPEIAETPETIQTPEVVKTAEIAEIPESVKTPESVKSPETVKTPESTRIPKTVITPEIIRIPAPVKTPAPELSVAQKREQLIASASDLIQTNWTSAKGDKRVLGDVVWSNAQQKGYVRLRDLPVLDASKETYQLWIVDDERNEKTPVSGGIFNVSGAGEIIIPINAQLRINKPKQFAISKEKAGGVVVTKPDRIVAVAKI